MKKIPEKIMIFCLIGAFFSFSASYLGNLMENDKFKKAGVIGTLISVPLLGMVAPAGLDSLERE